MLKDRKDLGKRRREGMSKRERRERDRENRDKRLYSPFLLCPAHGEESRVQGRTVLSAASLAEWLVVRSIPASGHRSHRFTVPGRSAPPEASWGTLLSSAPTVALCTFLPHFSPLLWRSLSSHRPPPPRGRFGHHRRSRSHFSLRARRPAESLRVESIYTRY